MIIYTYNKMMTQRSADRRTYGVIQFSESPGEGIDDYVCVPNTWLMSPNETAERKVIAYPTKEDPSVTKERVKNKEEYNKEFKWHVPILKYEADSYSDAESWITTRKNDEPLVEEESKVTDKQPKLPGNKRLCSADQNHLSQSYDNFRKPLPITSIKRSAKSELKLINKKRLKLDETAQSSNAVVNDAIVESSSSKRKLSAIIQDNQSVDCTDQMSKTQRTEQTKQVLRSPLKNVNKSVTNISVEDFSHRVEKPDQNNSMSQANSSSNATDVSMTAAKPSTAVEQSTRPYQSNYQEHTPDRSSLSNFRPKIVNIQSPKPVGDHKLLFNEVSSHKPSTSHVGSDSHKNSSPLNSHVNRSLCLIPIQKPVEKRRTSHEMNERSGPMKMDRNLDAQNPSNVIDLTTLSTSSVKQPPVVTQNQSQNDPQVLRTHTGNSKDLTTPLNSIGMISQEIHGDERSRVLAASDPKGFQSVNNVTTTSQQLPRLSRSRSDGHQHSVAHEQYFTHSHQNQYLPTKQGNFQQELLRGSTVSNTYDHRTTSQTANMRIPSSRQNSTHLSNPMYQTRELAHQRQMQPDQRDSQQQPQRPKLRIHASTKPGFTKETLLSMQSSVQNSILQALSNTDNNFLSNNPQLQARMRSRPIKMDRNLDAQNPSNSIDLTTLSTSSVEQPPVVTQNQSQNYPQVLRAHTRNSRDQKAPLNRIGMTSQELYEDEKSQVVAACKSYYLNFNPQLQARMNPRSTLDTNVDFTTSPQNIIASETCDRQNTQMPSRSVYQPPRTQHTKAPENGYQKLCTQQELVDQSTQTSSKTKPVHFMDDAARTPVTGSHQNVTAIASQTDESKVKETLSLNHAGTLDSGAVIEISDSAMSTDVSPVETANNDDVTKNDSGCGSADKSTAAQNSTSTNHQTDTKVILVQRMLDNFNIILTQMGSILHYMTQQQQNFVKFFNLFTQMAKNFSSTAILHGKLGRQTLDAAKTYKDILGADKEEKEVTASASSSTQNQHDNGVANKMTKRKHKKLYQLFLPPEYDADDTRWTLKYRTNRPGLVELLPQSGVYVSQGELKHCLQVSKDCRSLVRRLLTKVFNRNALSVCSSMSEKASDTDGSNVRPELDDRACAALVKFVLEYGHQRGWNTNLKPIISGLHSKMQKIRFIYGEIV